LVPLAGIEPALLAELDFESSASTSSATGAFANGRAEKAGRLAKRADYRGSPSAVKARHNVIGPHLDSFPPGGYDACHDHAPKEANVTTETTIFPSSRATGTVNPALTASLAIAAIAAATLAGAWFFQLVLEILPCPLCLEQRYAYYFAVPFAAAVAFGAARGAPRGVLFAGLAILAAAVLANAVLGTYHAGVEWGFWKGPTDCTGPVGNLGSAGNLLERRDKVKVVRCDEVQWRFLGLSLAGYNVLISLLMAAIAGWGIVKSSKL
jgi:disulfide bond formation protein DsbB